MFFLDILFNFLSLEGIWVFLFLGKGETEDPYN